MKQILTALITPFHRDGSIDYEALRHLVLRLKKEGCDGFVVCGTTGETPTLRNEEKLELLKTVMQYAGHDTQIWYGCGGNDTVRTLEQIRAVESMPITGLLLVTPYYNKPNQDGLYAHFDYLASHTRHQIMLYHVPHRCGVGLAYETICALVAKHPNIMALKHAESDFSMVKKLKKHCPDLLVYSGEDALLKESLSAGCDGFVSVLAHLSLRMMREYLFTRDEKLEAELKQQAELLFADASPSVLKYILSQRGECENILRLPMTPLYHQSIRRQCASLFDIKCQDDMLR